MTLDLWDIEDGYTNKHECERMTSRKNSAEFAIEMIAKREGVWWAVCDDAYYKDEIFFCPFCGEKL